MNDRQREDESFSGARFTWAYLIGAMTAAGAAFAGQAGATGDRGAIFYGGIAVAALGASLAVWIRASQPTSRAEPPQDQSRSPRLQGGPSIGQETTDGRGNPASLQDELNALRTAFRMMHLDPHKVAQSILEDRNHCCKSILFRHVRLDEQKLREEVGKESNMAGWRASWRHLLLEGSEGK